VTARRDALSLKLREKGGTAVGKKKKKPLHRKGKGDLKKGGGERLSLDPMTQNRKKEKSQLTEMGKEGGGKKILYSGGHSLGIGGKVGFAFYQEEAAKEKRNENQGGRENVKSGQRGEKKKRGVSE